MKTTASSASTRRYGLSATFGATLAAAAPVVPTLGASYVPPAEPIAPAVSSSTPYSVEGHVVTDSYSKSEIDAKFEAQAARSETARVGVEGKIDLVLVGIASLKEKLEQEVSAVKDDNKTTRNVTLVTIVVSIIAAIGAIYAAQANNIAAMQVGMDAAARTASAPPAVD